MRVFQLVVNVLVLMVMLIQMYSGVVLSRYVFDFLPIESGLALARRLHILGAYWGILLMSLRLGLHWNMFLGILRRKLKVKSSSKTGTAICICAGILIAGNGVFVFVKRNFPTCLFLKNEFVFLDYSEPAVHFYSDYLALMGLCIFTAHYFPNYAEGCQVERKRKNKTIVGNCCPDLGRAFLKNLCHMKFQIYDT